MKVKCISTILSGLPEESSIGNDYSLYLKVNAIYTVYSISLWDWSMYYLILNEEAALPNWYPSKLFVVVDELLPIETYFTFFGNGDDRGINALWGYKEMVLEYNHYNDLIERDKKAIKVFLMRKHEIDEGLSFR